MNRPQRPQKPDPGTYDHARYQGSYAEYDAKLQTYAIEMLEFISAQLAALHEHRPSREEPRVRFYHSDRSSTVPFCK